MDEEVCLNDDAYTCDITNVSHEEASWIGALMPLGALASGPVTGILLGKIGRKWTMIMLSVPFMLGYIAFVVAKEVDSVELIYTGRILTGRESTFVNTHYYKTALCFQVLAAAPTPLRPRCTSWRSPSPPSAGPSRL